MASAPAGTRHPFWEWVRHHLTSIAATIVDYGVMVACVELLGLRPVPAVGVGASAGALTNFTMARWFTYQATDTGLGQQGWRYALVSVASLGLNVAGEYLFTNVLGFDYRVARVITSIVVSNAWNYPLQRFFVFSRRPDRSQHPTPPT